MIWGYPYFRKPPFGRLSYAEAKSFIFTTSSFVTEHWKFRSKTRRSIYLQTYLKRKCTLKEKNTWSSTKLEDRTSYTAMYALYIYILYIHIYILYIYIYVYVYIYTSRIHHFNENTNWDSANHGTSSMAKWDGLQWTLRLRSWHWPMVSIQKRWLNGTAVFPRSGHTRDAKVLPKEEQIWGISAEGANVSWDKRWFPQTSHAMSGFKRIK